MFDRGSGVEGRAERGREGGEGGEWKEGKEGEREERGGEERGGGMWRGGKRRGNVEGRRVEGGVEGREEVREDEENLRKISRQGDRWRKAKYTKCIIIWNTLLQAKRTALGHQR